MLAALVVIVFAVWLSPAAPAQQNTSSTTSAVTAADAIAEMLPEAMERLHVPGVVVGMVQGGTVSYLQGFGWADVHARKPMDPSSTLMRVGSISKLFVATAVAREVEAGRLDLAAPVNRYLSGFALPNVDGHEITVEHLLTHTAGFDEDIVSLVADPEGAEGARGAAGGSARSESLRDFLSSNMPALVRRPGQVIQYSNYGMALAAHVVESVSGQDFRSYVSEHILRPLEMTSSTFAEPGGAVGDLDPTVALASSYHWTGRANAATPYLRVRPYPAGSLLATAADTCKFMLAMLPSGGGGGVVSPVSVEAMQSKRFANLPQLPGIGLAWFVGSRNGAVTLSHGGEIWNFSSQLLLLPEHDFGIFIAGNGDQAGLLIGEAIDAVFASAFPAPELVGRSDRSGVASDAPLVASGSSLAYVGTYRLNRYPRLGPGKISAILMETSVKFSSDGRRVTITPTMGASIPSIEGNLRSDGVYESTDGNELIAFKTDAPGQAAQMLVGQWAFDKLPWYETGRLWLALFGACAGVFVMILIGCMVRAISALRRRFRRSEALFVTLTAHLGPNLAPAAVMSLMDLTVVGTAAWCLVAMPQWESVQLLPSVERALTIVLAGAQVLALMCVGQLISAVTGGRRRSRRSRGAGIAVGTTARWSADYATASTTSPTLARITIACALLAHVVFTIGAVYWGIVRLP
jgi:CubicO group peptidase (beta-lactamase class C family)